MSYKITISNPGNHIANPLLKLRGNTYATREEACEAIFEALYDIIDSDAGCETVDKSKAAKAYWVCSGEGERGTWHRIVTTSLGIKQHLTKERCGGDRWANALTDLYETKYGDICGIIVDGSNRGPDFAPDEARDDIGEANDVREKYIYLCHDYIIRKGYATEDGVTATVEEVAE